MVRKNQLKEKYDKMASEVAAIAKAKTAADQKLVGRMHLREVALLTARSLMRLRDSSLRTPTNRSTSASSVLAETPRSSPPLLPA